MNWLMQRVAIAVEKIPQMHKNGSWKIERFYWTDARLYNYMDNLGNTFYRVLFNLFNPLRSVGTEVEAVIYRTKDGKLMVPYMGFVNQLEWKMTG
jgi:hypothetical protein